MSHNDYLNSIKSYIGRSGNLIKILNNVGLLQKAVISALEWKTSENSRQWANKFWNNDLTNEERNKIKFLYNEMSNTVARNRKHNSKEDAEMFLEVIKGYMTNLEKN